MYSSIFGLLGERDSPPQNTKTIFVVVVDVIVADFGLSQKKNFFANWHIDIRRQGEEQDQEEEEEEEGKTLIHHLKQERG